MLPLVVKPRAIQYRLKYCKIEKVRDKFAYATGMTVARRFGEQIGRIPLVAHQ